MGTRSAACVENEPLAMYVLEKREDFILNGGYKEHLDETLLRVYRGICDSKAPICNLREASRVKGIGVWVLKLLKGFFMEQSATIGESGQPKAKKVKKAYIPQKNSAPYAILLTLYRTLQAGSKFMLKQELIEAAEASGLSTMPIQPKKCAGPSGQFGFSTKDWYSGWNSMKTLVTRGLVAKSSCPAKYKLTEEGEIAAQDCFLRSAMDKDVARSGANLQKGKCPPISAAATQKCNDSLLANCLNLDSSAGLENSAILLDLTSENNLGGAGFVSTADVNLKCARKADYESDMISSADEHVGSTEYCHKMQGPTACNSLNTEDRTSSTSLSLPPLRLGERFSDAYDIIIILDDREQYAHDVKGLNTRLRFAERLRVQYKIEVEIRRLPVGDTIWIARHKITKQDYVLDFVVERKKVSDLLLSIRDARYKQQKLRLLRCGLRKLIYLLEGDPNAMDSAESIKTACFTTEIAEGFDVQRTRDIAETLRKYGELTHAIIDCYNNAVCTQEMNGQHLCRTYNGFLEHCCDLEKESVSDVFGVMLMQVRHVTEDIALSILQKYPTPLSLALAYSLLEGNVASQEKLLSGIEIQNQKKTISTAISKGIYKLMWSPGGD